MPAYSFVIALLLFCLASSSASAASADVNAIQSPALFEENLGQAEDDVRFVLRGGNTAAILMQDRIVFGIGNTTNSTWTEMKWIGGADQSPIKGLEKTIKTTDYIIGNNPDRWVFNVPTFERVRYSNVYPGIDLVFYQHDGALEYDFIVSPGADPSVIHLRFDGQTGATLTSDGVLELSGAGGVISHQEPILYQVAAGERTAVAGRFVSVGDDEFQFEIGAFDPTLALVVDPRVTGSRHGGSLSETAISITAFSGNEVAVVGVTESLDFLPGSPPPTGSNIFVSRARDLGPNSNELTIVSERIIGGQGDDSAIEILRGPQGTLFGSDISGSIIIGGTTNSSDFPIGSPKGGNDQFIGVVTPGEDYMIGVR